MSWLRDDLNHKSTMNWAYEKRLKEMTRPEVEKEASYQNTTGIVMFAFCAVVAVLGILCMYGMCTTQYREAMTDMKAVHLGYINDMGRYVCHEHGQEYVGTLNSPSMTGFYVQCEKEIFMMRHG